MAGANALPYLLQAVTPAIGAGGEVLGNAMNQMTRGFAGFANRFADIGNINKIGQNAEDAAGKIGGYNDAFQTSLGDLKTRINGDAFRPIATDVRAGYNPTLHALGYGEVRPDGSIAPVGDHDPGNLFGKARQDLTNNIQAARQSLADDSGLTTNSLMASSRTQMQNEMDSIDSGLYPPAVAEQMKTQVRSKYLDTSMEAIKQSRAAYADKLTGLNMQAADMFKQMDSMRLQLGTQVGLAQSHDFATALDSDRNMQSWVAEMNFNIDKTMFDTNVMVTDTVRQLMSLRPMLDMDADQRLWGTVAGLTWYPSGTAMTAVSGPTQAIQAAFARKAQVSAQHAAEGDGGWF